MIKEWVVVDATDQVLGRLGAKVAKPLRGKYKPSSTPHVDCGDNVIITDADEAELTGNKWNDKIYLSCTGYPDGQREIIPACLQTKPDGDDKLLRKTVKGILLKNKLGAQLLGNMHVYADNEHKHEAQSPETIDINALKQEIAGVVNTLDRRKSTIVRTPVGKDTGKIAINKGDPVEYFSLSILQYVVKQPLNKPGVAEEYDIRVNLCGDSFTGQSWALRPAIARVLVKVDAEDKAVFRAEGFTTRDPHSAERGRPGQLKARHRSQFSKR